jgi:glycosyltransferase involved in cell wall biosynthesis
VILPTYNRAHLISRSIQSVLAQTYNDFELIVVDDGSTDNTEEVVRALNDRRISYLKHSSNRGVSAARNTGIKAARGSYIAFQDSDDEWLPQKLEKQLALFQQDKKGDLGLVLCERLLIKEREEIWRTPETNRLNYEQLLSYLGAFVQGTPQFLFKRDLTEPELYFDENLRAWEDWDLMVRISRICRIDYVKEVLVRCHEQNGRHFGNVVSNSIAARDVLFRKYADELKTRPRALNLSYLFQALNYSRLGQMACMRSQLKAAIKAYPWNPVPYLLLAVSLSGRRGFQFFLTLAMPLTRYYIRAANG